MNRTVNNTDPILIAVSFHGSQSSGLLLMSPRMMLYERVVNDVLGKASLRWRPDVDKISLNLASVNEWDRFKRSFLYLFQPTEFLTLIQIMPILRQPEYCSDALSVALLIRIKADQSKVQTGLPYQPAYKLPHQYVCAQVTSHITQHG